MKTKDRKFTSVDGHTFKIGDKTYYLQDSEVKEGVCGIYTHARALFYNIEKAELFLIGRTAIEKSINKDYRSCECVCGTSNEYGCNGWENKPYISLHYNRNTVYDAKSISEEILRDANEKVRAIKVYEMYKDRYDV